MKTKFIDKGGREAEVATLASFIDLIESGQITADTPLFDSETQAWRPAREWEYFSTIQSRLPVKEKEDNRSSGDPSQAPGQDFVTASTGFSPPAQPTAATQAGQVSRPLSASRNDSQVAQSRKSVLQPETVRSLDAQRMSRACRGPPFAPH